MLNILHVGLIKTLQPLRKVNLDNFHFIDREAWIW